MNIDSGDADASFYRVEHSKEQGYKGALTAVELLVWTEEITQDGKNPYHPVRPHIASLDPLWISMLISLRTTDSTVLYILVLVY